MIAAILRELWLLTREVGQAAILELLQTLRLADDKKAAVRKAVALAAMQRSYRP
ncbi:MAG TPA: hypothetical protein VNF91_02125 [Candidatus Acidoferrum sp.]|jgi:hypothetical protein|nr:hypothetical protein [Candidatus Acidoferrum sp.]